jgi:ribosome-associated protein YbcJ (S4-like RNA binding protein)
MTGNLYSTKAIHLYGADAYITLGLTKDGTSKCYIQTEGTSDGDLTAGFGFSWNKSLIIDQSGNITLPAGLKLPTSSNGTTLGLGSAGQVIKSNGTTVYWANDNNTTYSAATASAAGLMSAADKSKLDAITASADAIAFTRTRTSGDKIGTLSINGDTTDLYSIAYTASKGIKLNGVNFEHTNSITAKTAYATSSTSLTPGYGGSFTVYEPKYDAYGHITGVQSISVAMPGAQSIPSLSGGSAASADTSVVGGVTVSGHAVTVGKKTLTAGDNVTITGDKTSITISSTDTDTHWTTSLYATSASGTKNAATANGATYLRLFDNSTARSSINIKGSGSVSVASNDAGVITISGTDTDTTYSAGTGLALSGTTFNHSNSITAKTTYNQSTASPGYGGTFKITEPKYDAQGHITGVQVATITMPAAQTIPSLSGGDAASADASVVGGVTVNGHTITIGKKTLTAGDNVTITGDASSITISSKDTNTHYKTYLYATGASGKANAATSNGNTYLRIFDNTTARSSINVKGTGSVSVSSDANGVITIAGTDTDTTYTASDGITLNGTVFKHSNAITAKTTYNQNTASPGYGGTFKITEPKYDA